MDSIGFYPAAQCIYRKPDKDLDKYGKDLENEDHVGVYIDFDIGSIRFLINGEDQGEAVHNDRIKKG